MSRKKEKRTKTTIIIVLLLLVSVVLTLFVLDAITDKKVSKVAEFSEVKRICELATLECYYHNVAEKENQPDHWWNKIWKEKKYFFEYEGIIKIGIDFDKVEISQPDEKGVVRIFVPQARVLDGDHVVVETIGDLISEKGALVKITTEERAKLLGETQEIMKKNAEEDEALLNQAQQKAKDLLEKYVTTVGEGLGQSYTVEWIEK